MNIYLGDENHMNLIGAVHFNDNKISNFRSQEKKMIKLNRVTKFIKLEFSKPYENHLNLFNQIGR